MPSMVNQNAIMKPELILFYVLDTSGSMRGEPITRLNRAMIETIEAVRDEAPHNREADIKVAVLEFNSVCRWVNPQGPQALDTFVWHDLNAASLTSVGLALDELNSKLVSGRGGFIDTSCGSLMPVIIFMTDGYANDDYQKALDNIRHNKWFTHATRVGFAIGKNPDIEMIARLTGDSEAVLRTEDLAEFAEMIKWASVTSSVVASQTSTSKDLSRGRSIVRMVNQRLGKDPDDLGHNYHFEEEIMTDGAWGPSMDDVFAGNDDWDIQNPF